MAADSRCGILPVGIIGLQKIDIHRGGAGRINDTDDIITVRLADFQFRA
jgi:hypothetical protein